MPTRFTMILTALAVSVAAVGGFLTLRAVIPPTSAEEMAAPPAALTPGGLTQGPSAVIAANPEGDITVIEFFDYQCPICRRVHPDIKRLGAEDTGVRVVHKHWPVFGAPSVYAAKLALAAQWQGRYEEVHDAFMKILGKLDHDGVRQAAIDAGLDIDQAEADLSQRSKEVQAVFSEAEMQAHSLQLRGTPAFIIGNYLVPGGLDYAAMREIVSKVRDERKEGGAQ